jgi:hypothetical protein
LNTSGESNTPSSQAGCRCASARPDTTTGVESLGMPALAPTPPRPRPGGVCSTAGCPPSAPSLAREPDLASRAVVAVGGGGAAAAVAALSSPPAHGRVDGSQGPLCTLDRTLLRLYTLAPSRSLSEKAKLSLLRGVSFVPFDGDTRTAWTGCRTGAGGSGGTGMLWSRSSSCCSCSRRCTSCSSCCTVSAARCCCSCS